MDAFELNVKVIRKMYGNRYDNYIEQARKHFQEEVVPVLEEHHKAIKKE